MRKVYVLNIEENIQTGEQSINAGKFKTLHFPMGLGLIVSALKTTNKYAIHIYDNYIPGTSYAEIIEAVKTGKPEYVLLSGFLGNFQYTFMKKAINDLKKASPSTNVIMGGPMASCIPELLIDKTNIDYVVVGEGEETAIELLRHIDEGIPVKECQGIVYRDEDGKPAKSLPRARIKDLSTYPHPPYEMFNVQPYIDYVKSSGRCWEVSTSRGCYAKCGYCRLTFGQKISFRSYDHVLAELRYIVENFGINRFNFVDDNFLNSPRQVLEFVEALKEFEHKIQFRFQARADKLTPALAVALRDVGCFDISMGLESGSQRILNEMQKSLDVKKAAENIRGVLAAGISIHATFIVGMPGETTESMTETLDYIKYTNLPYVAAGILTPFPDTRIYTLAKERKLILDDDKYCSELGRVYEFPYVNLTEYSDNQLLEWRDSIDALSNQNNMVLDSGFNREIEAFA